jgi:hypothetical protein
MNEPNPNFRTVNRILGAQPNLGPIPANQVLPWAIIIIFSWFVSSNFLGGDFFKTILLAGWLMGTWWILTGNHSWRFLSKFVSVPNVTRGHARYQSLLVKRTHERKTRQKKNRGR